MADPVLPTVEIKNKALDQARKAKERADKAAEKLKQNNAKQGSSKFGGKKGAFDFLKTTNDWLEEVPVRIIDAFDNFMQDAENITQQKVDEICEWLAWKVNVAVERKRQTIVKILHDQYDSTVAGKIMNIAKAVKNFYEDPIGSIMDFASVFFGPVMEVFKWAGDLVTEVLRLAENLAKIMMALPPSPPNPHINYDKFMASLVINSISMDQIAADPNNLPSPETMFPEPKKPFTKETFANSFDNISAKLKSGKKKYTLSEADKKSLQGFSKATSLQSAIESATGGWDSSEVEIMYSVGGETDIASFAEDARA